MPFSADTCCVPFAVRIATTAPPARAGVMSVTVPVLVMVAPTTLRGVTDRAANAGLVTTITYLTAATTFSSALRRSSARTRRR
jgi:hypothetical protein